MLVSIVLVALLPLALGRDTLKSVKTAFEQAGIVPDVVPAFDPSVLLKVTFENPDGSPLRLTAGTLLTPAQASVRPTFSIARVPRSLAKATFLIAEVDPDAPTPQAPTSAQIRHFLAPDFTLIKSRRGLLANTSAALSEYRGPNPPAGSDPHRYTFLLFVQNHPGVVPPTDFNFTNIAGFNISHFVSEVNTAGTNRLRLVGGTFFRSQNQS